MKSTPSDHYLVEAIFDLKKLPLFIVEEYYKDPKRRPPIKKPDIPKVNKILTKKFKNFEEKFANHTQSECYEFIENTLKSVFDKFCPLNSSEKKTRRIYKKDMSKSCRDKKCTRLNKLNVYKRAKKNLKRSPRCKILQKRVAVAKHYYQKANVGYRSLLKKESVLASKLEADKIRNNPNYKWEFRKKCQSSKPTDTSNIAVEIDGKSGTQLANHMNQYLLDRAHLVPETVINDHQFALPLPENSFQPFVGD